MSTNAPANVSPSVSVCLCTYNGEKYLKPQLDSILSQSHKPDEVIVVDDCSSDNTVAILQDYANRYQGLFHYYLNETNLGYKKNFAKAFSLCTKDIVFFADQDDLWNHHKIERVLRRFSKMPDLEAVATGIWLISKRGRRIRHYFSKHTKRKFNKAKAQWKILLKNPLIPGTALAVKRQAMQKWLPIPSEFMHDEWFTLCASVSNHCYIMRHDLTFYRQHAEQALGGEDMQELIHGREDYDNNGAKYLMLLATEPHRFSPEIMRTISERGYFLCFRSSLRQESAVVCWGIRFRNPVLVNDYHRFCLHPFWSRMKDTYTKDQ
jgi:glycosyltransferase involved in cell wall biosynthesis